MCSKRKATDTRDRTYALIGVVAVEFWTIPVDYGISSEQLWKVVMTHYSQRSAEHCQKTNPWDTLPGSRWKSMSDMGHIVAAALEIEVTEAAMSNLNEAQLKLDSLLEGRKSEIIAKANKLA